MVLVGEVVVQTTQMLVVLVVTAGVSSVLLHLGYLSVQPHRCLAMVVQALTLPVVTLPVEVVAVVGTLVDIVGTS
jgi:hypothetical protein